MKIPNRLIVFFLLLFITNSSFAQLQKGDVWLDFSQQKFQRNRNILFFSFDDTGFVSDFSSLQSRFGYGKFIGHNTLLGFRLNTNLSIDKSFLLESDASKELSGSLFVKRYFGQKPLRLFAETSLNTELYIEKDIFSTLDLKNSEYINWKLGAGLAYFINQHTALEFSYNLRPLAFTSNGTQLFSKKLAPDFGIGLRYFILKNQDDIQNLKAAQTLEKGTLSINFDSDFLIGKNQRLRQMGLSAEYFVKKNLQLRAAFGFTSEKYLFEFEDIDGNPTSEYLSNLKNNYFGGLSSLYFFKVHKNMSVDAGIGVQLSRNSNVGSRLISTSLTKTKLLEDELNFRLGLSLYLGRHLLRPYALYQKRSYDLDAANIDVAFTNQFSINLDYELFLAKHLSISAGIKHIPNHQKIKPGLINFDNLQESLQPSSLLRANFGFKWYLRRGNG